MQNRFWRGLAGLAAPRIAVRMLCAALALLAVLGVSQRAEAYPWMIRHGYTNCSGCHADPSGGELLTLYGHAISWEALSTKWGGSKAEARRDQQRVEQALARAAHQKSAGPKKIAAEKVDLDDDSAAPAAKAPAGKPAGKAAADKAPAGADADAAEAADAEDDDTAGDAKGKGKGKGKKPDAAAKESGEDEEDAAEEEEGDASKAEPAEASASASGGAEESPFAGMSGLTGPLFGLMKPNENLLLGGSMRLATIYKSDTKKTSVFPMQLDLYGQWRIGSHFRIGGSAGAAKVPAGSPFARPAQVTSNQADGYNLISRTHWVGFDFGDGAHSIRIGRLNLPFGVRMSEHVMWVRDKTETNRESQQQHGASLYLGFDKVRLELMGILGNYQINPDMYRERGYAGYVEFVVSDQATLGVSSLYTEAKADMVFAEELTTDRSANGLFARAAASKALVVLAEADLLTRSRHEIGYVGFLQFDIEPVSGLHGILTGEVLDAGYQKNGGPDHMARQAGLGKAELGGWVSLQWFFLPHFDFRVDAIVRQDTQILGQLHVYL